jgi:hypothetical protein
MFHQQLCINKGTVSLTSHHNVQHIVHKNKTLYLYSMKDSAKLMVDNWNVACSEKILNVSTHTIDWEGYCLDPGNNLNVTFLHKETWRYRVLET